MPEMFPSSKKQKGLRKCVFSTQASIYYRVCKIILKWSVLGPTGKSPITSLLKRLSQLLETSSNPLARHAMPIAQPCRPLLATSVHSLRMIKQGLSPDCLAPSM